MILRRAPYIYISNCYSRLVVRKLSSIKFVADEHNLNPMQLIDFKKYLKKSKISFKDGHTCVQLECRLCQNNGQGDAYINKHTGILVCASCDVKKTLSAVIEIYQKGEIIPESKVEYSPHISSISEISQEVCDSIGIRGLTSDHIKAVHGRYDVTSNALHFVLRNVVEKVVGEKILYLIDKREETFQTANMSGLLIYGPAYKNKAIIVTNILDFIVLTMQNFESHCIVCLPYFLKTLPQECLPSLERFKELVFWFNFDYTGWDAARTFAIKLNEKRCLLIRPTDTEPAPLEANQQLLNLNRIVQRALPVRHESITTFRALRNDVLSELQNIEKVNGVKWKRFPILNKLLKGHRRGELSILTGPTGSGKTTFMSEYSLDLALQGVSTLWGSFEIRNSRLAATLLRQFVGYSLENKLNEFNFWATTFEKYPLYFMTFHGQQSLKVVMDAIEHAQYVHDINHVIIDNLQFMMGISMSHRTDKFWEQDAIIAAFRSLATNRNIHVTLVMHPRKERQEEDLTTSSVFGTAKATQEADNVLIIQDKRLTSARGKKYLQIVKNRYSGDLGIMPLVFDKDSLSYASITKKKPDTNVA